MLLPVQLLPELLNEPMADLYPGEEQARRGAREERHRG